MHKNNKKAMTASRITNMRAEVERFDQERKLFTEENERLTKENRSLKTEIKQLTESRQT